MAFAITSPSSAATTNEVVNLKLGGDHAISVDYHTNTIRPGRSSNDTLLERQVELRNREVLARQATLRYSPSYKYSSGAEIIGSSSENCVAYAKRVTGISKIVGAGGRSGVQGTVPRVGAIGVQRSIVHAVVIEAIEGEEVTIKEANYEFGHITRRRLRLSEFVGFIYN